MIKMKTGLRAGDGDMTQEQQFALQTTMDRKAQFETALSNIMKKTSDTSSSIVQNLK